MATKDLQILNLKFDQVMFDSLVLTWETNFEVTFGIFSVLVFQISVLEGIIACLCANSLINSNLIELRNFAVREIILETSKRSKIFLANERFSR